MKRLISSVLVLLVIGGCARSPEQQKRYEAYQVATEAVHQMVEDTGKVQAFLANTTTKSYGPHGTQIEFLGADGRTYLWYPGNFGLVAGQWRIEAKSWGNAICFLYGQNTFNPLTLRSGGDWECNYADFYLLERDEIVAGDPLRLSRQVPYVLPKAENVSIGAAMAKAGFGRLKSPNKAPVAVALAGMSPS